MVDHADHRPPPVQQGHQDAEGGLAGDERLGAVDGVQHPHVFGVGAVGPVFLADDAVVRLLGLDQGAQGRLGGPVGFRHGAGIGLGFGQQAGAEADHDLGRRHVGQPLGQDAEGVKLFLGHVLANGSGRTGLGERVWRDQGSGLGLSLWEFR